MVSRSGGVGRAARVLGSAVVACLIVAVMQAAPSTAASVFADGFESGDLAAWSGSVRVGAEPIPFQPGSWVGSARSSGDSSYAWRTFGARTELWSTVWFKVNAHSGDLWLASLRTSGGNAILQVGIDTNGFLIARSSATGTTYRSGVAVTDLGWHEMQVHLRVGSGGRFDVALDSVRVGALSRSGDLGSQPAAQIAIGDTQAGRSFDVDFDDISVATDPGPADRAADVGRWGRPFDVGVEGVHATVLFTGKVLLFYETGGTVGTVAKLWDPATGTIEDVSVPIGQAHNLFCAGHSIRPNGHVFVTGGTLWNGDQPDGTKQTAFFRPMRETWTQGPLMQQRRWYPTDVTLPDGDALVFSGIVRSGVHADLVERYDEATDSFSTLPDSATLSMRFYPRMFIAPDGRIARVGPEAETMYFDPSSARWSQGPSMLAGSRIRGSAVLLGDGRRVLGVGGAERGGTTATAELVNLGASDPSWRYTGSMARPRRNLNAVLLPDGQVLAVGGNRGTDTYDDPVLSAELYDPASGRWTQMAAQQAPRAYHSTAVLLPDGRVLSAGQTNGDMRTTAEIYSPPYLFAGPRPSIIDAPRRVTHGESLSVRTDRAADIDDVVLIRPGTVTHGVNFDQRSVSLPFSESGDSVVARVPTSSTKAPPGWYMMFLVDETGVPSIASWVQVS